MSSHAGPRPRPLYPAVTVPVVRLRRLGPLALGAGLATVALIAKGGTELATATWTEIAVTLVGAAIAIVALLYAPTRQRRWGGVTLALLGALAAWSALSIAWSVAPADSWAEANRLASYVALMAAAIGIARLAPERGRAALTAVLVACLAICVIALFEQSFPAATDSTSVLARLREPLGYFNALGLMAALAVPACLWLGARRDGPPGVRALGYPLLGLALITLVFSYSRGALLAMAIGVIFWFAVVPLRLRGLVVLLSGALATVAVTAWAFSQDALAKDRQPLADRIAAGHSLALWLVLMLVVLMAVGMGVGWLSERRPLSPQVRRISGVVAICLVALLPVAGIVALSLSQRGLPGSVSNAWNSFFSTSATAPSYGPDRLTATGSKRGSYWREAEQVWSQDKLLGAGAGGYATARLRYRNDAVDVRHAHGYVPQSGADLGLVGLLISLGLLVAWLVAARRSTRRPGLGPWAGAEGTTMADPVAAEAPTRPMTERLRAWPDSVVRRFRGFDRNRIGHRARATYGAAGSASAIDAVEIARLELLTLVAVVITFGVHSAIDWTWAFPGTALIALLAAGYVAGHGPLADLGARRSAPVERRTAAAVATAVIALVAAWGIWQPLRAQNAANSSQALLAEQRTGDALLLARDAVRRDPVSPDPLFQWAAVESQAGHRLTAVAILQQAVRMQPENPETWRELGTFELDTLNQPSAAYAALRAASRLDPKSPTLNQERIAAYRRLPRRPGKATPAKAAPAKGKAKATKAKSKSAKAGAQTPTAVAAKCRSFVRKAQGQLRSGSVKASKAAKKRAKLSKCQALLRRLGG